MQQISIFAGSQQGQDTRVPCPCSLEISARQKEDLHRRSQRSRRKRRHTGVSIAGPIEMQLGSRLTRGFLRFRPDKKRIDTGDRKATEPGEPLFKKLKVDTGALPSPDQ